MTLTSIERLRVMSPIETNTKLTSAWQDQPIGTNACPTRVIVPALLEFLYEWMPLHLIHDIAELRNAKWALQSEQL